MTFLSGQLQKLLVPGLLTILVLLAACGDPLQVGRDRTVRDVQAGELEAMLSHAVPRWRVDLESRSFGGSRDAPDPGIAVVDAVPLGFRSTVSLGENAWLQAELYTRRENARVSDFISVVTDPDNPGGSALRLSTVEHTDGVLLRSVEPLPENYRISFRIGHIDFGGERPLNGYSDGDETGAPWMKIDATNHNGVYWGAIMDTPPQPNGNIWSHHHRKFFIDTWNYPGRMYGVTIAGVLGKSRSDPNTGKSFVAHDGAGWREYSVKPAFRYKPRRWYRVLIERRRNVFRFSVNGEFRDQGYATIEDSIDAEAHCLYHYNRSSKELNKDCLIGDSLQIAGRTIELWPEDSAFGDYFMLGDPHINFYEGAVLVDDLKLEPL